MPVQVVLGGEADAAEHLLTVRVPSRHVVGGEAESGGGTRRQIGHQHVGAVEQPVQKFQALRRLQVEGDRLLAAVHPNKMRRKTVDDIVIVPGEITALRVLDLDHPGPEVGERARAHRRGYRLLQGDDGSVIAVEIDGYGPGGPISQKRAYDLLIQAESGVCSVTGRPGEPAKPGPPVADVCSGLYAALSISALLRGREREEGRRGNAVRVSLFDAATELMGYHLTYARHSGIDQQPLGMSSPAVAPYGAYRTADAQTVVLGTTNDREWQRLAREILQRDDLADDERFLTNSGRVTHREILDEAIGSWCAQYDLTHVQKVADAAGIGNARYNVPSEVLVHPQLAARDRWRQIDTPGGPVPALLPPPVISGYDPPMGAVPGLGQHTDSVLAELGLDDDEISRLREDGAVGPVYT